MASHNDQLTEEFVAYIGAHGIPEQYHALYKSELVGVLLESGVNSIDQLDVVALGHSVRAAEKKLRARRVVCVALERFLAHIRRPPSEPEPEIVPDSFDGRHSIAIHAIAANKDRKYVRVPYNGEVEVDGSRGGNRASDISVGGMYLETVQAYEAGSAVRLRFRLRPNQQPLEVDAQIVYFDPGIGAGVDFVDLSRDLRLKIREYVEAAVRNQKDGRW